MLVTADVDSDRCVIQNDPRLAAMMHASTVPQSLRSITVNFDDSFGKGVRSFLAQIVPTPPLMSAYLP